MKMLKTIYNNTHKYVLHLSQNKYNVGMCIQRLTVHLIWKFYVFFQNVTNYKVIFMCYHLITIKILIIKFFK